jgi:hypothetical protein
MAHLWILDARGEPTELELNATGWAGAGLHICRVGLGGLDLWVAAADADGTVLFNGLSRHAGIRVLMNRDEIRAHDGTRVVFSDEHVARVTPFAASDEVIRCARCTGDMEPGTPAVQCPVCRGWYHEAGDYLCWSSVPFCQGCGTKTTMGNGEAWTPEEA